MAETGRMDVRAEMYLRDGRWNLLVRAPQWVVGEFGAQQQGHRLWVHNYGGGMGSYSFLVGFIKPLTRRQHLKRAFARPALTKGGKRG